MESPPESTFKRADMAGRSQITQLLADLKEQLDYERVLYSEAWNAYFSRQSALDPSTVMLPLLVRENDILQELVVDWTNDAPTHLEKKRTFQPALLINDANTVSQFCEQINNSLVNVESGLFARLRNVTKSRRGIDTDGVEILNAIMNVNGVKQFTKGRTTYELAQIQEARAKYSLDCADPVRAPSKESLVDAAATVRATHKHSTTEKNHAVVTNSAVKAPVQTPLAGPAETVEPSSNPNQAKPVRKARNSTTFKSDQTRKADVKSASLHFTKDSVHEVVRWTEDDDSDPRNKTIAGGKFIVCEYKAAHSAVAAPLAGRAITTQRIVS